MESGGAGSLLVGTREHIDDSKVRDHFYDRHGILVFATGTASRSLALPRVDLCGRLLRAVLITFSVSRFSGFADLPTDFARADEGWA